MESWIFEVRTLKKGDFIFVNKNFYIQVSTNDVVTNTVVFWSVSYLRVIIPLLTYAIHVGVLPYNTSVISFYLISTRLRVLL